jgi:hypothetical protein
VVFDGPSFIRHYSLFGAGGRTSLTSAMFANRAAIREP